MRTARYRSKCSQSWTGKNSDGVRQTVRALTVERISKIRHAKSMEPFAEEWPALPNLQRLMLLIQADRLETFLKAFRASALPALQSVTLLNDSGSLKQEVFDRFVRGAHSVQCPLLEGCFEQLQSLDIRGFVLGEETIRAVIEQPLVSLRLCQNDIGAAEWRAAVEALKEHANPSLTRLVLSNRGGDDRYAFCGASPAEPRLA